MQHLFSSLVRTLHEVGVLMLENVLGVVPEKPPRHLRRTGVRAVCDGGEAMRFICMHSDYTGASQDCKHA